MSQELIYTSAPTGLKPGTRGFCTVCSTQGMLPNLAERLESLSGYRHVFAPRDPQASLNPVVWSHLRIVVGGRSCHVLSRIAAAGLDYTQRSNQLAHHVVLDPSELVPAGPAALMLQSGFMETDWNGQPHIVPVGRRPPPLAVSPSACRAWQESTGDAGWGGVLAEAIQVDGKRPRTIIFRPGMELLPLIAESLALLPAERRWQVTFSTYYTKLPPGVDCQLRGIVDGTPEAAAARRTPDGIIDLCRPLGSAPAGPLVEAARTGVMPARPRPPALPAAGSQRPARDGDLDELVRLLAGTATETVTTAGDEAIRLAGPALGGPPPLAGFEDPLFKRKIKRRSTAYWPMWLAVAAGVLIATGTWVAIYVTNAQKQFANGNVAKEPEVAPIGTAVISPPPTADDKKPSTPTNQDQKSETTGPAATKSENSRGSGESTAPEIPAPSQDSGAAAGSRGNAKPPNDNTSAAPELPKDASDPFASYRQPDNELVLVIPECKSTATAALKFSPLLRPNAYKLKIIGQQYIDPKFECNFSWDANEIVWLLKGTIGALNNEAIAIMRSDGKTLKFEWQKSRISSSQLNMLRNCILEIIPLSDKQFSPIGIRMRYPQSQKPLYFHVGNNNKDLPPVEHHFTHYPPVIQITGQETLLPHENILDGQPVVEIRTKGPLWQTFQVKLNATKQPTIEYLGLHLEEPWHYPVLKHFNNKRWIGVSNCNSQLDSFTKRKAELTIKDNEYDLARKDPTKPSVPALTVDERSELDELPRLIAATTYLKGNVEMLENGALSLLPHLLQDR